MEEKEIFNKVVNILSPFAKDKEALAKVSYETNILTDLKVNSSRLVDIILAFEDEFNIEIPDEAAEQAMTIGAAVKMLKEHVFKK